MHNEAGRPHGSNACHMGASLAKFGSDRGQCITLVLLEEGIYNTVVFGSFQTALSKSSQDLWISN